MSSGKRIYKTLLLALCLLTVAFIWGNSMLDRDRSSNVSNTFLVFLNPFLEKMGIVLKDDKLLRKIAHFAEFAVLGAELSLLYLLTCSLSRRSFSNSTFISLLVATVDETIQFFSGRFPSFADILLDFSGSLCTIILVIIIHMLNRKKGA